MYFYPEMLLDAFLGMTIGAGFLDFVGSFSATQVKEAISTEGFGNLDINLLSPAALASSDLLGVQKLLPRLL